MTAAARETWVHIHMVRAGQQAGRQWDELAKHPGRYHAAALTDLCRSRGLGLSTGCALALTDIPELQPQPLPTDSEGGEVD